LKEDHRTVEIVGEVDGGSFAVQVGALRVRTNEGIEIARLELVRVLDESDEVTDSVVTRAGIEEITFGKRDQRGEPTGRSTGDRNVLAIGQAAPDKMSGSIDAIVDVDHAP